MKTVELDKKTGDMIIRFSGSGFGESLAVVRTLYKRTWHNNEKVWTAPDTPGNREKLLRARFSFIGMDVDYSEVVEEDVPERIFADIDPSKLPEGLMEFQIQGVRFIEGRKGLCGLFDDQGLGKTVQAVAWLKLHPELRPALIVCPATIKINWQREIKRWSGESAYIWPNTFFDTGSIFIENYDVLRRDWEHLCRMGFRCIIADECSRLANHTTKTWKSFKKIITSMKPEDPKLFLSGTPLRNRPKEFFNVLHTIAPKTFHNRTIYQKQFCNPTYTPWGMEYKGASNLDTLHQLASPFFLRRTKPEVLTELPPKTKTIDPLPLDDILEREYFDEDTKFFAWVNETKRKYIEVMNKIAILRQLAYQAKRNSMLQWIKDWLRDNPDEKIVLFGYHKKALDDITDTFGDICVRVDGSITGEKRQTAIDRFQEDPSIRIFAGQILAAGQGITLTKAYTVAFIELWWVPADMVQAEDRCHRIGQNEHVQIHYLVAAGTIEDDMAITLMEKYKVVKKVLDNQDDSMYFDQDYLNQVLKAREAA